MAVRTEREKELHALGLRKQAERAERMAKARRAMAIAERDAGVPPIARPIAMLSPHDLAEEASRPEVIARAATAEIARRAGRAGRGGRPRATEGGSDRRSISLPRSLWERLDRRAAEDAASLSETVRLFLAEALK